MDKIQTNTIYLVRHGENPANISSEFSCKLVDYSLTPKGILQAQQTADFFKDKQIDEIYASPLKRARETATYIAEPLKLPVHIMEEFREVNVGSFEGRPPTAENWREHNLIVQDWFEGRLTSKFPDGEDYITLLQRMRAGLRKVTQNKTGEHIVIVGHGGIFTRTMKDICPTLNIDDIIHAPNYNCSITTIELTTDEDRVEGKMISWASYAHLHGEATQTLQGMTLMEPEKSEATTLQ